MIKAIFYQGGNVRKILIEGRKIMMIATETNWSPVEINVDKIESLTNLDKIKDEKVKEEFNKLIQESIYLTNEFKILEDITKDFHKSGWKRIYTKEGINE